MKLLILMVVGVAHVYTQSVNDGWAFVGNPLLHVKPCEGNVLISYEPGLAPSEENQYNLFINGKFPQNSRIRLKFDAAAVVTLSTYEPEKIAARITNNAQIGDFDVNFFKEGDGLALKVKGITQGVVPYLTSLVVNTVEYCKEAKTGYLDSYIQGYKNTAESQTNVVDTSCGRRQVSHTGLIVNGQPTKPGDWPWHAALYVLDRSSLTYICGGTLLSKTMVLTAAHCVTIRGVPRTSSTLSVVLGKYNLLGGDTTIQEREVQDIIVHDKFESRHLNDDIALLRLKSEVVFGEYVQPACLWNTDAYKRLPHGKIYGTVVGWGFDNTDTLSTQLQQIRLPKVSEATCIKSNPLFYATLLTEHKFCAGYTNGTSACNGDSGGGYVIFVPDTTGDSSPDAPGAWYVRGIVSMSVARRDGPICNPNFYGLYTDVAKFRGWVTRHMN